MTILLALTEENMKGFGVRQITGLLLSVSMILIGYLGLTGTVTADSVLFASILVAVAVQRSRTPAMLWPCRSWS